MPYSMWGIIVAPLTSILPFFLAPYIGIGRMGQAVTRNKLPPHFNKQSRKGNLRPSITPGSNRLLQWSPEASFLDVVSIHQADADLKERGIYGTLMGP